MHLVQGFPFKCYSTEGVKSSSKILSYLCMFKLASTLRLTVSSKEHQKNFNTYLYMHVSYHLFEQARLTHMKEVEEISNRCNQMLHLL